MVRPAVSVITFLVLLLTDLGCGSTQLEPKDAGRMLDQIQRPIEPMVLPWHVCVDDDFHRLQQPTLDAIAQWHEWSTQDGIPREWFLYESRSDEPCVPRRVGNIHVSIAIPNSANAVAEARFTWNVLGEMKYCDIVVHPDFVDHPNEQLQLWMEHELGHCMGLAHDEAGTNSLMESPTPITATLTAHDFEVLTERRR